MNLDRTLENNPVVKSLLSRGSVVLYGGLCLVLFYITYEMMERYAMSIMWAVFFSIVHRPYARGKSPYAEMETQVLDAFRSDGWILRRLASAGWVFQKYQLRETLTTLGLQNCPLMVGVLLILLLVMYTIIEDFSGFLLLICLLITQTVIIAIFPVSASVRTCRILWKGAWIVFVAIIAVTEAVDDGLWLQKQSSQLVEKVSAYSSQGQLLHTIEKGIEKALQHTDKKWISDARALIVPLRSANFSHWSFGNWSNLAMNHSFTVVPLLPLVHSLGETLLGLLSQLGLALFDIMDRLLVFLAIRSHLSSLPQTPVYMVISALSTSGEKSVRSSDIAGLEARCVTQLQAFAHALRCLSVFHALVTFVTMHVTRSPLPVLCAAVDAFLALFPLLPAVVRPTTLAAGWALWEGVGEGRAVGHGVVLGMATVALVEDRWILAGNGQGPSAVVYRIAILMGFVRFGLQGIVVGPIVAIFMSLLFLPMGETKGKED